MSRRPVRMSLTLMNLEDRTTPVSSPGIRQGYIFDGPAYSNNPPVTQAPALAASPSIAVGPNHHVTVTNNQIVFRTIPNGSPNTFNLNSFMNPGFAGNPVIWSGAKVIFDPEGQRFVVAAAARATSTGEAKVLLAASDDPNPNGTWYFRFINANLASIGANNYATDIGLASDEDAVYLTTSHYLASNNVYQDARVTVINKDQWFANLPTSITTLDPSLAGQEAEYRALQPAQVYGTAPSGNTGTYFVSYSGVAAGADTVRVARIDNPLGTPTFTANTISVTDIDQGGALPDAPQSGSATPIDTGDREVGNAVWQNDRLYFAATIDPVAGPDAGQATAHWFIVNTTNNTVANQGDAPGTVGLHTFFPTVSVDLEGSMAIVYSGSEGGDTVKSYYAARHFSDGIGVLRDQVEINPAPTAEGTYVNLDGTTNVWGPSTSVARDPIGRGFYAFGAFATTPASGTGNNLGRWATKGVGFSFNWAPEVVPGGMPTTVDVDEDAAPTELDLDPAFNDYEDLVVSNPALPLNFDIVQNSDPTLVTVQKISRDRFTLTFAPNANGSAVLLFQATDSGGATATFAITVNVDPVPDPPTANADSYTTAEDVTLFKPAEEGVLANDTDPDVGPLTAQLIETTTFGALDLNPDGSFTYTPALNFSGTDTFRYRVADNTTPTPLLSNTVTVTITVTAVNDAPEAENDPQTGAYPAVEDQTLNVPAATGVLANDSDVENSPLTAVLKTQGSKGTVTLNPNGSFSYVPNPNAFGFDTFTYAAFDGSVESAPATVTIDLAPVDDVPVANNDSYSTPEDETLSIPAPGILANDQEFDLQALTLTKLTDPLHGDLTLNADGSFTYVPDPDFFGTDSFTYTVFDGTSTPSAPATVTITVDPENDAPVAVADSYKTPEDVTLTVAAPGVRGNDTDVDGTTPTVLLVAGPAHAAAFTLSGDGSFTYTPVANYFGPDSFTYKLNDGATDSNTVTVTLTVNPVQDAPLAADDGPIAVAGKPIKINVLANDTDVDRDRLSVQSFTAPTKGTVTRSGSQLLYSPRAGLTGADSFTYKVSDGKGNTDTATVSLTLADTAAPKVQAVRVYYGPAASVDLKMLTRSVLSWENITRVDIVFTEAVDVDAGDLTLAALGGGSVTTTFGGFNATTRTATWTFGALAKDRYSLRLSGTVQDLAGNALGADWARSFAVLPGDFDGNGVVNATDVSGVKGQKGKANANADINGDGVVNDADTARVTANLGQRL
jgi:VCBS repeat-containing protein